MTIKALKNKFNSFILKVTKKKPSSINKNDTMSKEELLKHIAKWMYAYQEKFAKTPEESEEIEKVYDQIEELINKPEEKSQDSIVCAESYYTQLLKEYHTGTQTINFKYPYNSPWDSL